MKKIFTIVMMLMWSLSAFAAKTGKDVDQILDVPAEPVYRLSMGYIADSPVETHGDVSLFEVDGYLAFAHIWDVLPGDIDMALRVTDSFISDSTDIGLPAQLARIALDAGWTGRFRDGYSVQARVYPGIYSDLRDFNGASVSMPVSLAAIKTINPSLSAIAGAEFREGFQRSVMPLIGVAWMIDEKTRLEARLPDSRLVYYLGAGWSTHVGMKWESTSFAVHAKDSGADRLTVEDVRFYWGATFRLADDLQFTGDIGRLVSRSMDYNGRVSGPEAEFDVSPAVFVRLSLCGPF